MDPTAKEEEEEKKKKVVVVMGATGTGKSRLAIDLASHLAAVEVINADSMQVYRGLDVLTNKVPLSDHKGVPHHLLGTVDPSVEFTSKNFRDTVIPIIDDILSRDGIPVIVGGTNYYIQALVSPFLVDDVMEDMGLGSANDPQDMCSVDSEASFEQLKEIDPVAANRIHPNDHRKIKRYLSLYASSGVLPSVLLQGKAATKWGRAEGSRYDCCFIWIDASLPVLDRYVDERVDCMIGAGLLEEVQDIYKPNADYTRGLRQAIGVQEFEEFFRAYLLGVEPYRLCLKGNCDENAEKTITNSAYKADNASRPNIFEILDSIDDHLRALLVGSIDKLKANTRKLVRRQKRRLNRLKTYFGWDLHYIDATEAFFSGDSVDSWHKRVVEPCIDAVKNFLSDSVSFSPATAATSDCEIQDLSSRGLWAQYVCEACGNQILRGTYEWEQHMQGRRHRKRVQRMKKKCQTYCLEDQQHYLATENSVPYAGISTPASA